ncbi:hypothetical protein AXE65_11720 [Ventosimonas gracilis]|uniref:Cell division protein ZipA n=1 Tax=Ventosimonas gracilis TaxID=1680762 RepID=A0A139SW85_9GAMM|nr:cell division protein ZipA [Ventosimonas gracilis]KXU38853.1 hypothetical protein AXE65_11720 [Ventosimonas gracilis]
MQIGLREWLMVLGGVLLAFILFDGWRRMRSRSDRINFDLDKPFRFSDENDPPPEARVSSNKAQPLNDDQDLLLPSVHASDPEHHRSALRHPAPKTEEPPPPAQSAPNEAKTFDDVLVIHVLAKDGKGFFGPELLQCVLESGLRFGEREIFHRHESKAGHGEVLFSMANAVKPGTFDLAEMDLCYIRAVAFYLLLPGPHNPKAAFSEMLAAVRKLESELGGEVKDDQHSVLTAQTIEHYRQRIGEFERKKLLNR